MTMFSSRVWERGANGWSSRKVEHTDTDRRRVVEKVLRRKQLSAWDYAIATFYLESEGVQLVPEGYVGEAA